MNIVKAALLAGVVVLTGCGAVTSASKTDGAAQASTVAVPVAEIRTAHFQRLGMF